MDTQNNLNQDTQPKDEKLWKFAKKRAEFKKYLLTYLVINVFLWGIWFFNASRHGDFNFPWPAFVTLGWGVGLAFSYIGAYSGMKETLTEREYEKLKNKQN